MGGSPEAEIEGTGRTGLGVYEEHDRTRGAERLGSVHAYHGREGQRRLAGSALLDRTEIRSWIDAHPDAPGPSGGGWSFVGFALAGYFRQGVIPEPGRLGNENPRGHPAILAAMNALSF